MRLMKQAPLALSDGDVLRDAGIRRVIENEDPPTLLDRDPMLIYRDAFLRVVLGGEPFTAEDVRARMGDYEPHHHNWWGAAFSSHIRPELKSGRVRVVGMAKMRASKSHSRITRVYQRAQ